MLDPARTPTAYSHGHTQSESGHPQPELGRRAEPELVGHAEPELGGRAEPELGGEAESELGGEAAAMLRLAELIRGAGSIVALTGAGISVPSGIPDFRSPGTGMWEKVDPMEVAHIDAFRCDPVRFWRFYGQRFATLGEKLPNGAHRALAALEQRGVLDAVITQNVDMLHRRAGTRELLEVHGSIASCGCPRCGGRIGIEEVRSRLACDPQGVPRCEACDGPLKPGVVLFGEMLPEAPLERARELCEGADVLLCIGSSLEVHPVAGLPRLTHAAGGAVAILTQGPTPLDDLAQVRLSGDVVQELQALTAALAPLAS